MFYRRPAFTLSLAAAALLLGVAAQGVSGQTAAQQPVAAPVALEQPAAPNHPRRAARSSTPRATQEAAMDRAGVAPQGRAGSSSALSVADDQLIRSHSRARGRDILHVASSAD